MALWNEKNLPMPPINTYKAVDTIIDIKHLSNVFREGKKFFDNSQYLSAEYAVMSRIIYRMKQKFRSAKDFKMLEKVHKALDNYFKSNISHAIRNFSNLIPSKYTSETYLPNKNMLDYILVRLQGLVKLFERIVETCKITAYLFNKRMQTGHFWKLALMIFAVVSRVYVLAKNSTKFTCDFYRKIMPFSRQLMNNGCTWLPKDYMLPADLQQWLNVPWLDVDDELQIIDTSEIQKITQFFDLIDDDDDDIEFCNEYIMVDDDELFKKKRKKGKGQQNINRLRGFDIEEDVGEIIEVEDSICEANTDLSVVEIEDSSLGTDNKTDKDSLSDSSEIGYGEEIKIIDGEHSSNIHDEDTVINILDNSLPDVKITSVSVKKSSKKKHTRLENNNLSDSGEDQVITVLDSPILNRNSVKKARKMKKMHQQSPPRKIKNDSVPPIINLCETKTNKKKLKKKGNQNITCDISNNNNNRKRKLETIDNVLPYKKKKINNKQTSNGNKKNGFKRKRKRKSKQKN